MNKKEISEIRRQLTPAHCTIDRIAGCYVDGEKKQITKFKESFLSLAEEEIFKYSEILRKALSGTLGKNLVNMEFPLDAEREGQSQYILLQLRDSALEDDALLEQYYDRIIKAYDFGENYLILLAHAAYDVPGRASDDLEMFDASDEVYSFILSCICPVSLAKPALSYDASEHMFRSRIRDWIVDMPLTGFLFPAFNDRSSDIHCILYYSRKAEELHEEFTAQALSCTLPLTARTQKEVFEDLIEEALGDECDYETVRCLHEQLHELTEQHKDSPDPVVLDQGEVKQLLNLSGAGEEQLQHFDRCFEETAGSDALFMASNIVSSGKYEVRTPDVTIQVSPDRSDLVETRMIDGRPCLVIPITDEVQVNGIRVSKWSGE